MTPTNPHIFIAMAVYNGAAYLQEQLDSIAAQDHASWHVLASDDGSADDSRGILHEFAARHPLTCVDGPRRGGAANFLSLIHLMDDHAPRSSWLAFSDQDDIWLPERLSRGVTALQLIPQDTPALYCSRLWVANARGEKRCLSPSRPRPPGFRNALVQNIASGNTILLNAAGARLVQDAARNVDCVVVHDWWVYQLITGSGGTVIHDDTPTVLYRQHDGNQIGANNGWFARFWRIWQLLRGDFRNWNSINFAALRASSKWLTQENLAILNQYDTIRQQGLIRRLLGFSAIGLYRQSLFAQMMLWVALVIGRV